ncbi:MAG TPA: hypothetical protein VHG71_07495 [Verrucomicrobiae bacterium]|nr:hypothetical protein [Verrucomicrobiae bacterium]
MATPIPPTLQQTDRPKRLFVKIVFLAICFGVFFWILIPAIILISTARKISDASRLNFTSYTDTFTVKILEIKSEPNHFEEKIGVRCHRDMNQAGISAYDLNNSGIFKTNTLNGEMVYRWGHPEQVGYSIPVHVNGEYSTCEMFFSVTTTSTNTIWHSEIAGGSMDTSLPSPMAVSEIKTNWPNSYQRGTAIPLANLGEYKILLSVK